MRVLHLSADYPDPLASAKTRAVSNLLALTAGEVEHRVYSLNRVGWRVGVHALSFDDAGGQAHRALAYGAPPKGLLMNRRLEALADWILDDLARQGDFRPDIVHAHKLSVEGLAGARIAAALGKPFALSIQGNTDLKIVGARPDLRPRYSRLWHGAAMAFPFAPWAATALDARLGPRGAPVRLLPCPGPGDTLIAPRLAGPLFRTAFHFAGAVNKNASRLIGAISLLGDVTPGVALEIAGGGDPAAFADLHRIAEEAGGATRFVGAVPHERMQAFLNGACATPLVSYRESFGMVFSEALLAGTPCLIPRGRAIDGYFEEGSVLLAADPRDDAEIVGGLERLVREEGSFKARLAALGEGGGLDFLRRDAIAATYRVGLREALAGSRESSE